MARPGHTVSMGGGGELRLSDSTAGLLATWHHHVVVQIVKMLNPLGRVVNCGCREPLNPPLPSSPLDTPRLSRFHEPATELTPGTTGFPAPASAPDLNGQV